MFRLALLILILAALVIFALQNLLPVLPLVFLGIQTQALPLAVWVVGAIAAGAVTTVLLAVLIRLAGARTGSRVRRPQPRGSGRASRAASGGTPWTPPPWTGDRNTAQTAQSSSSARGYGKTVSKANRVEDDWDQPRQSSEAWDNWDDDRQPVDAPRRTRSTKTVIQDASYADVTYPSDTPYQSDAAYSSDTPYQSDAAYQPPYSEPADSRSYRSPSYAESEDRNSYQDRWREEFRDEPRSSNFEGDREEWDDWEEESVAQPGTSSRRPDPPVEPELPPRKIVEIQQKPQAGYQTGSVFSYTYRSSAPSEPEQPEAPNTTPGSESDATEDQDDVSPSTAEQTSSVYDAEFRVIIPPYRTPAETPTPEVGVASDSSDLSDFPDLMANPNLETDRPEPSDDWDEADGDDFAPEPQRPTRPQRTSPNRGRMTPNSMEREVWDDWDDDDVDDEPEDDSPPPSTSPEGNPPLRLG